MSKNNVNPNHYKVAGRGRQGEDIAQARNTQKHAENVARRRTEIGAKSQAPAPQPAAPTRAAKTAARKASATPLRTPPARKSGPAVASAPAAPRATRPKAASRAVPSPTGAAPAMPPKQATKRASVGLQQGADKRGMRSTAQKREGSSATHQFDPMPETKPVAGAFGKEPSPRRRAPRKA